ncbi:MAG TPA: ABC transporter permease [Terriglobia bacterium]|nr:ABC transporter permease [Terriglobia bacterium]
MRFVSRMKSFLRTLLYRRQIDTELDEEIRSTLELLTDQKIKEGMLPDDARRAAKIQLGGVEQVKEGVRAVRAGAWLDTLLLDLRIGLRMLRQSPGFTAVAVLTLALGIGATTAIFTLVQQVMLRSLPVARPDQLWRIGDAAHCCYSDGYTQGDGSFLPPNDWSLFSWEAYKLFRANTPAFEELAAFQIGEGNAELGVRRAGSPAPVGTANGEYVSGNFFKTFGISAWRGRLFGDADDQEGASPVAVMSFHTWQGKYGSDPSVVGAAYEINGYPFTIIGIAPPGFFGAKIASSDMPDFWLPLTTEPLIAGATARLKNPRLAWLDLIGRVRPGGNPKTLEAQLQVELHQWLASHRADMTSQEKALLEKQTLHLTPGGAGVSLMRENYKQALWLLLMAALCVLLVACANLANLLLARGLKDRHQTALRAALGASRARLVRKALAESLTLSVLGATAGIAVAYAGASLILHLAITGPDTWVPVDAAPSTPALLFALGISVITGVVFGLAPAWMTSHAEPIEALRGANRSVGGNRHWAQKMLVIVQATVSLVLLSAAAMLGQSLRNLEHQNFGFDTSGRYLVSIDPKISNYKQEQLVPLFREIEDLRAIPGVRMVSAILEAPLRAWAWGHAIRIEGKTEDDGSSGSTRVTPGFFETLGDKIVMGRPITDEDNADTRPVVVINEAFAKRFFGKESPIGQHFGPAPQKNAAMYEIVGVASDIDFGDGLQPIYFLPEAQTTHFDDAETEEREVWSHYLYNVVIWAPGNPPGLEVEVKRALANVDPNLVVYGVQSYSEVIHADFAQQNMIASLTWLFGAVGLVLAAVGLYGVTAYGVEQRTSEIGVRMALGADRGSVLLMVLRGAFWQVGVGLVLGIPAAVGAGYLIASQLFGVRPWDPLMLSAATLLLGLAALIAAVIPARRATRIDPMEALRCE